MNLFIYFIWLQFSIKSSKVGGILCRKSDVTEIKMHTAIQVQSESRSLSYPKFNGYYENIVFSFSLRKFCIVIDKNIVVWVPMILIMIIQELVFFQDVTIQV